MRKLRVLDLFSGIGGFSLGLERTGGFETAAFCEIEEFPRRVLAKHWPNTPCFMDVRKLTTDDIDGPVDVICGGYPCQPFSTAGRRKGEEDDRHLWPEVDRLVDEFRPSWFIGENVAGHVSLGLDSVLFDLEGKGYSARPFIIPACAVDAKHRRDRVWIIATKDDANSHCKRPYRKGIDQFGSSEPVNGKERQFGPIREVLAGRGNTGERHTADVADPEGQRIRAGLREDGQERDRDKSAHRSGVVANAERHGLQGGCLVGQGFEAGSSPEREAVAGSAGYPRPGGRRWLPEPDVGRVAHGVPDRAHRLKALGNAVVPQIPEMIGYAILQAEREREAA